MKFETPKMNISMFAAENVATTASDPTQPTTTNYDNAYAAITTGDNAVAASNIFTFSY